MKNINVVVFKDDIKGYNNCDISYDNRIKILVNQSNNSFSIRQIQGAISLINPDDKTSEFSTFNIKIDHINNFYNIWSIERRDYLSKELYQFSISKLSKDININPIYKYYKIEKDISFLEDTEKFCSNYICSHILEKITKSTEYILKFLNQAFEEIINLNDFICVDDKDKTLVNSCTTIETNKFKTYDISITNYKNEFIESFSIDSRNPNIIKLDNKDIEYIKLYSKKLEFKYKGEKIVYTNDSNTSATSESIITFKEDGSYHKHSIANDIEEWSKYDNNNRLYYYKNNRKEEWYYDIYLNSRIYINN